jgi:hypothetical protein
MIINRTPIQTDKLIEEIKEFIKEENLNCSVFKFNCIIGECLESISLVETLDWLHEHNSQEWKSLITLKKLSK